MEVDHDGWVHDAGDVDVVGSWTVRTIERFPDARADLLFHLFLYLTENHPDSSYDYPSVDHVHIPPYP